MLNRRSLVFVVSIVIFFIFVYIFWDYSIDDAFITFRYAENLSNGYGLVFNPGGEPVEGYSNFLWLLLLAGFYKIGISTYSAAKILGILAFLLTGHFWFRFFSKDKEGSLWLAGVMFLLCPLTAFWAVSGLELGLHALLLVFIITLMIKRSKWLYLILPFFILSRPESPAIAIILILTAAIIDYLKSESGANYYFKAIIIIITSTAALLVFRLIVFGYPLPNTYYAKTYHDITLGYRALAKMLLIFLPLTLGMLWWVINAIIKGAWNKTSVILFILFGCQALISSRVDPIMNFLFRYMIPFLPLALAITLITIFRIKNNTLRLIAMGLCIISLLLPFKMAHDRMEQEKVIMEAQWKVIEWANPLPENTEISITDMGRIPYYARKLYYDLWGLVNKDTAHKGYNAAREFGRVPDYFIMVGYRDEKLLRLRFNREQIIATKDIFTERYEFIKICVPDKLNPNEPGYYYLIFKKKGLQK